MRVGFGYDAHRLVTGRQLVLAGVTVPNDRGLEGFSDADVASHAVIDAVLGAAGLGDCGTHFPAGDPRFAGARGTELLEQTVRKIAAAGLSIINVDCTIVAEQPALAAFISSMREQLARALGIDPAYVNVKAKRTEGLGFTGEGNGIEAYAVALVEERK
jgi:2-C-methyl-D-erythritol 2,4-cyclodiphosphate synthase